MVVVMIVSVGNDAKKQSDLNPESTSDIFVVTITLYSNSSICSNKNGGACEEATATATTKEAAE